MDVEAVSNGTQEEDSYSEGDEEDLEPELCPCLFCKSEQTSAAGTLEHCRVDHRVDLPELAAQLGCDHYSCVKMINYIRKESAPPSFLSPLPQPPYPWDNDSFLQPVLEQDPLLLVDWESETEQQSNIHSQSHSGSEEKAEEYKTALSQALTDLQNMRLAMRQLVGESEYNTQPKLTGGEAEEEEEEEEEYFSTYSHFSIHLEMLSDRVRTEAYRNFISKNPDLFQDKVVLDVGCGTGILSLFAAQAGAKLVIAVDHSFMVYNAMQIVRENGYEDKIKLIRGKLEEVQLPVDKVDIIISEWMGYFLLFESMLDTVIFSRDKWLTDSSHGAQLAAAVCLILPLALSTPVFPNVCSMQLAAVSDETEREARIDFWDNVYGFKMSCMKTEILREASVQCVEESSLISSTHTLKEFDLTKVTVGELQFEESFQLTIEHNSLCHAIVGFFEAGFEGPQHSEVLKTGPQSPPTHWKQTVFYLQEPLPVQTGDVLEGKMGVSRSKKDARTLDLTLSLTHSPLLLSPPPPTKPLTLSSKYILR